ncbi:MAG: cation transporter [Alphaproteobacteria bacterium]|nr:cation transporter [Alphaproteobacteria bacterium]
MKNHHHHHNNVSEKSVSLLMLSFAINIALSFVELVGGILSASMALVADALHNTSDALSILIACIAFKIGRRKATEKFSYGFGRAETIGAFANLVLLFVSGVYLVVEGVERLWSPQRIDGVMIIWISLLALVIDAATAKISHHEAHHNTNMKMLFVHNLADAFGSLGVIVSGIFVLWLGVYRLDGVIALCIAGYMIFQAVVSFPEVVKVLMNAAPDDVELEEVKNSITALENVDDVHHIHLWRIDEHEVALECHVVSADLEIAAKIAELMKEKYGIAHCNIQLEKGKNCQDCCL